MPLLQRTIDDLNAAIPRQRGLRDGMRPLRVSGAMKVVTGVTTVEEVLKATPTIDA